MKSIRYALPILFAALALSTASFPAAAGPDWPLIEQARKAHAAQAAQPVRPTPPVEKTSDQPVSPPANPSSVRKVASPVLQLDHGPRAQTTPYMNQRHWAQYKAQRQETETAK